MDEDTLGLEDLSQDVYLFGRVRLTQIGWLGLAMVAGVFLMAVMPLPWLSARLLTLVLPVAATAWWLHVDGPLWLRRWLAFRRRQKTKALPFMDGLDALAETITPIVELGPQRYLSAAEVVFPPFALATEIERQRRIEAWAGFLNTCVAHGVQVSVFIQHGPWRDARPYVVANRYLEAPELRKLAEARMRHFARETAASSYQDDLIVRMFTTAGDAAEAWHRFQVCAASLRGAGGRWEWLSGAFLYDLAAEWADPGGAIRRFVMGMEAATQGGLIGGERA